MSCTYCENGYIVVTNEGMTCDSCSRCCDEPLYCAYNRPQRSQATTATDNILSILLEALCRFNIPDIYACDMKAKYLELKKYKIKSPFCNYYFFAYAFISVCIDEDIHLECDTVCTYFNIGTRSYQRFRQYLSEKYSVFYRCSSPKSQCERIYNFIGIKNMKLYNSLVSKCLYFYSDYDNGIKTISIAVYYNYCIENSIPINLNDLCRLLCINVTTVLNCSNKIAKKIYLIV